VVASNQNWNVNKETPGTHFTLFVIRHEKKKKKVIAKLVYQHHCTPCIGQDTENDIFKMFYFCLDGPFY
jgi:hypothetical protein